MANPVDLDAYFHRIGYGGGTAPSYATLAGLIHAHTASVPFENFDVLLGRGIRLDLDSLQAKLVRARRGGYCFEHSTLFAAVLKALGFTPTRHAARVILFQPRAESPRTHMFLTVPVDGARYVIDPGFGPYSCRFPLPLDGRGVPPEQPTHRLLQEDDGWVLHVARDGAPEPSWVSTMLPDLPVDFEIANHYTSTFPSSLFVNAIMASAVTPQGRVSLMNNDVTDASGGAARKYRLADRAALRSLLASRFGFDLPQIETMRVPAVPGWN